MGVAIPQIITEDRASGALIVDGGLRFDGSKSQYLSRTPDSVGNRNTWTFSCWIKLGGGLATSIFDIFSANSGNTGLMIRRGNIGSPYQMEFFTQSGATVPLDLLTSRAFRDFSGWYHVVGVFDTTNATQSDRARIYINGVRETAFGTNTNTIDSSSVGRDINNTSQHRIGSGNGSADGQYSQFYFIDGQALDASYFGYTDALTNTWRPKKLSSSVAFGTNGFYLPFDGSAPIGQDQSGRGNNWTPVNFGGSNTLEKATGALPILNTDGGGKIARVGVRTDSSASSLVLALPLVGIKSDFSNAVNSGTSNKAITANGNAAASSAQSNFYGGSFYFDGTGDYLETSTSNDFVVGTGDFTLEGWFNVDSSQTVNARLFGQNTNNSSNWDCYIDGTSGTNTIYMNAGNTNLGMSFPSANTWHHFCIVRSSGVLYSFMNGVLRNTQSYTNSIGVNNLGFRIGEIGSNGGSGYTLKGYVQDFRIYKGLAKYTQNFIPASTDPDILPDTPSGVSYSSNLTQITDGAISSGSASSYLTLASSADFGFGTGDFTVEFFVYETAKIYTNSSNPRAFDFGNTFQMILHATVDGSTIRIDYADSTLTTSNGTLFVNKWNHIALVRSGSTLSLYINGVFDKSVSNSTNVPTPSNTIYIGRYYGSDSGWINGFISNFHVVKGTALYTSNFTPPTAGISSVANTKLLCCKSNSSATAFDVSPGTITANGNAVATNFNPFTVNINTQRGKQSGYCTLNPLDKAVDVTLSNGNLEISHSGSSNLRAARATIKLTAGKWYCEAVRTTGSDCHSGIITGSSSLFQFASTSVFYGEDGKLYIDGSVATNYGITIAIGDVVGIAVDMDAAKIYFYKNGTLINTGGTSFTTTGNDWFFKVGTYFSGSVNTANFGQKPFKFPPPAGFQPLALANTPRPTIVRPDQFVGVSTYSGTGAASRPVTNLGFKPDFVWIKNRSSGSYSHQLFDSVRGASAGCLYSDLTNAQDSNFPITSFDTSGFTLGSSASLASQSYASQNGSGSNYVGWAWKAGGNSNTFNINDVGYATASDAGLTAGSITPTGASVNTKSGFSIITWVYNSSSGSICHGLGAAPQFIIQKDRTNGSYNWDVYHVSLGATQRLTINRTNAAETQPAWNNTSPTSTLFYSGSSWYTNGDNMVSYCWAEIPGFSKFGIYTGNGSSDGSFVCTGFRPRWLMVKSTNNTGNWGIWDGARNSYNESTSRLTANQSAAELNQSATTIDILSNGFKPRNADSDMNASGYTYIYAAFAETPTQNLYGAQANAR